MGFELPFVIGPEYIAVALFGVVIGIIFGAIPGMTATMAVAVFLPLTYAYSMEMALYLLLGLYVGGISGGLVPAILINIPGTPSSVCTTFDGHPMALRGEGERALKIGVTSSFMGGMISLVVLALFTPILAGWAIKFSAVEKFLIILFALTVIAALSRGQMLRGLWIGMLGVLVAMMKVNVSQKTTDSLKNVKEYQMYLGRYILFFLMGLLQSGLICLGDLYYLGIQCEHPFLFVLAGWMASVAFVNLIYTLTVSFGDIGKAICVVLLVIQVAGSGGTFPIEVAPAFFKKVYLFLPFTHSMAAMRECIGGLYGNTYWTEMGRLGLFLAASLLLGLVLRKPVIRLNHAFMEKLESTKIM